MATPRQDFIDRYAAEAGVVPPVKLPTLVLTVGLPKSGKTTWARAQGCPVVSPDAIRLALHGQRYVQAAEPFVWATAHVMVRALFGAGHDRVIVDATNMTRTRRDDWREDGWLLAVQNFSAPLEECVSRAAAEGDEEIIPTIERMAAKSEPPDEFQSGGG